MEEHEAIARLKAGDIGGLEILVHRYQVPALKVAVLIGRDYALAEDIVQAAFLRAYERIDQFDAARPFGPWFLRGVANDARKAVTRRPQLPLDARTAATLATHPDPGADLDALLAAAETREALWAALDQLAPEQRSVVVARYYLDLSDAEVARQFAIPAGTARRRLHDARRHLRRLVPAWIQQPAGE